MAIGLPSLDGGDDDDGWMAEINTTPLVDVMLVLLIIFLLTVPVVSASVHLRLPEQSALMQDTTGEYVLLSIDARGNLYLNDSFAASPQALSELLAPYAARSPKPELHIRADAAAPYSAVAPVLDLAQSLGYGRVGLLTRPQQKSASQERPQ